jgi:uncharacterized protein (DUF2141 family)
MRIFFKSLFFLLIIVFSFSNCARRGTPTGGPKDSIPPILVEAKPKIESINFKEKKIKIYFDEYIKLKDVKKNLIISPPAKNDPVIYPVGSASKFISIEILDTLDVNTTYSYNFGRSIVDNNEENELGNFKYVFSTGSFIDSLFVKGEVTDPNVKKSVTNIDVMLYEYDTAYTDSVIFKQKPRYISNTLDSTLYEITNIRSGKYLLMALQDANGDKIYDPNTDKIGFLNDTLVLPTEKEFNLSLFKAFPDFKAFRPKENNSGHLLFGYNGNPKGMEVKLLSDKPANFKSELIFEEGKDTLNFWYPPFEADSLVFNVSNRDFSEDFVLFPRSSKIDTLKIQPSTSSELHLLDTLFLQTNTPIIKVDNSKISIIDKDTLAVDFTTFISKNKSKLYIEIPKKYSDKYKIDILPKAITDIYEITNDSLTLNLSTKTLEDYGTINLDLQSELDANFIVELTRENGDLVRQKIIDKPQVINFKLLPPGNYIIKVLIDENRNGKWDTGDFLLKKQPERIKFFETVIELKANWDDNETFVID